MQAPISKATTNVTFLANAPIAQRSCACGKVRAVGSRAAKAFMGCCDPYHREPCADCGCQVDVTEKAGHQVQPLHSRPSSRYADDECSVCGAIADTYIDGGLDGCAVRVPICLDCACAIDGA